MRPVPPTAPMLFALCLYLSSRLAPPREAADWRRSYLTAGVLLLSSSRAPPPRGACGVSRDSETSDVPRTLVRVYDNAEVLYRVHSQPSCTVTDQ